MSTLNEQREELVSKLHKLNLESSKLQDQLSKIDNQIAKSYIGKYFRNDDSGEPHYIYVTDSSCGNLEGLCIYRDCIGSDVTFIEDGWKEISEEEFKQHLQSVIDGYKLLFSKESR